MRLYKPFWANHNALPIYSVHVDSNDKYVAVGGLLGDNGCLSIWSYESFDIAFNSKRDDQQPPSAYLFRSTSSHAGCVNVVRFQPLPTTTTNQSSRTAPVLLASGGADCAIMLWKQKRNEKSGEWACAGVLRGHSGDVLGLEWYPLMKKDGRSDILASCSVDRRVIVWDVRNRQIIITLSGHSALVKGLAWDPAGRYLASQGDDKCIIFWRIDNWSIEYKHTRSFEDATINTDFLRLGWSPDGVYVAAVNALQDKLSTVRIFERPKLGNDDPESYLNCVGFSVPVQVAAFSPRTYKGVCFYILCGLDGIITVWRSDRGRPFKVVRNMFTAAVLDVCWSSNGKNFFVCSKDGTMIAGLLKDWELSKIDEHSETLEKLVSTFGHASNLHDRLEKRQRMCQTIKKLQKKQQKKNERIPNHHYLLCFPRTPFGYFKLDP